MERPLNKMGMKQGLRWGLVLALAPMGLAHAGTCEFSGLANAGIEVSTWNETNADDGRHLVRENGELRRETLGVRARCRAWESTLTLSHAVGSRWYDGMTNRGAEFHTDSGVSHLEGAVQVLGAVSPNWSLGARLSDRTMRRTIESRGEVLGYPEHYRFHQAALGAKFDAPGPGGLQWSAQAWLGGGPSGTVDVRLPGFDPASLTLGANRMARLVFEVSRPFGNAGWSWQARAIHQQDRWRQGPAQALPRGGLLAGSALQPESRLTTAVIEGGVSYRF